MRESIIEQLEAVKNSTSQRRSELIDYINSNLNNLPPELREKANLYFDSLDKEKEILSLIVKQAKKSASQF